MLLQRPEKGSLLLPRASTGDSSKFKLHKNIPASQCLSSLTLTLVIKHVEINKRKD